MTLNFIIRSKLNSDYSKNSMSNLKIDFQGCVEFLRNSGCSEKVVAHCAAVSKNAAKIAGKFSRTGIEVDVEFVKIAALLHDIGRSKTHGISHGIEGAKIIRENYSMFGSEDAAERIARVCERHIGAGLTCEEAQKAGLPPGVYTPETIEEKIIAHADNITSGEQTVDIGFVVNKFKARLGEHHPAVLRVIELADYVEGLERN